ncbi:hypothetical protein SAMN05421858_0803 [Haladaptatus litoreus]|uniref:Uncharacterized protein n=1 Tax=Haladaptatus litoreus TaxID=553468 RepID=A0A1N6WNI5_9EURY|nr:hypothetical protein [Haladaptatus litoreus]SIQ91600.1 hypothetical protein SAMN05421858_0803 [Haladaptatus litoreus]
MSQAKAVGQTSQTETEDDIGTKLFELVIGVVILGLGLRNMVTPPFGPSPRFIDVLSGFGLPMTSFIGWVVIVAQITLGVALIVAGIEAIREYRTSNRTVG